MATVVPGAALTEVRGVEGAFVPTLPCHSIGSCVVCLLRVFGMRSPQLRRPPPSSPAAPGRSSAVDEQLGRQHSASPACARALSPEGSLFAGLVATDMHVAATDPHIRSGYPSHDINLRLAEQSIVGGTTGPHTAAAAELQHQTSWDAHRVVTVLSNRLRRVPAFHFQMGYTAVSKRLHAVRLESLLCVWCC